MHRMDVRMSDRVRGYVSPCIRSRGLPDEGRRGEAVSAGARTSASRGELGLATTPDGAGRRPRIMSGVPQTRAAGQTPPA